MKLTGQHTTRLSRLFTGVIVLLWVLGFGFGGLAAWSRTSSLWQIADLFFDLSLVVTMVNRGGSLLRPSCALMGTKKFRNQNARRRAAVGRG
jgi:hypothetical protein